ncbi:hypothetical protein BDV59DRAFT_174245 [Aspergillus ambiguus]|uniref:uncharacterized protein n=1 Tax=Aspergillus ambiguus TaxID=176160 RepID=UPI003CCD5118
MTTDPPVGSAWWRIQRVRSLTSTISFACLSAVSSRPRPRSALIDGDQLFQDRQGGLGPTMVRPWSAGGGVCGSVGFCLYSGTRMLAFSLIWSTLGSAG